LRIGTAQAWLRAHIWLGLLSVPLVVYHSGGRLGGSLATATAIVFGLVIFSGIGGLVLQHVLPRLLLDKLQKETIYSQIPHVRKHLFVEAEQIIRTVCGPSSEVLRRDRSDPLRSLREEELEGMSVIHSTIRQVGSVQGTVAVAHTFVRTPGTEPLRAFFIDQIAPYLQGKAAREAPLRADLAASAAFDRLKQLLPQAASAAVDQLAELCMQYRQLDQQARLHFWLHHWLSIHLPLSGALLALLGLHICFALKYW